MTDTTTLLARRNRALGAGAPLFYEHPLHIVRGEGVHLYDADGRRYVDMYNNVPCVGHANPRVVEAMARQQATLNVHSRYLHEAVVDFCERLAALHGPQIESVILSCSGTEANEVALRMARFATGKRGILCTDATYHGNSELVGSLNRLGQQPSSNPSVRAFPFPEKFRPIAPGLSEAALCEAYLAEARCRDRRAAGLRRGRRGDDRLLDPGERRPARHPRRLHGPRRGDGARRRRPGDRRRGAGRLRPHRQLVGLRGDRLHPRHRRHRQADGRRTAARRHRREPRAGRDLPREDALLQHLRLLPAAGGGRHGGAGRDRATRPARQRRHRRRRAEGRAHAAQGRQRRDRRRAWPRPVHRRRAGEGPRTRRPTRTSPSG